MGDSTAAPARSIDVAIEPKENAQQPDLMRDITPQDQRLAFAADARAKEKAAIPGLEVAAEKPLTGTELEVSRRTQDILLRFSYMLPTVQRKEGESLEETGKRADKELTERKAKIADERERGVFGPASQAAYKEFIEKIQQIIPQTVNDVAALHLPIPPGCPMQLPRDKYNYLSNPELFRKQVASGQITCDLKLDLTKAPTTEALSKIEESLRFQAQCVLWEKDAKDKLLDDGLKYLIKSNGLPEKWAQPGDMDPESWRQSAQRMTTLAVTVRNYIEAGYQLDKANRYKENFKFELPPGVSIEEKDGKIVNIKMDLPEDLRLGHPRNQLKMDRLQEWLDKNGKQIDEMLDQSGKSGLHAWGDDAIGPQNKVVFDKDNNLKGIYANDHKPDEGKGEKTLDANLLEYRYDVKKLENGNIQVTQKLQAQNVPWWSYQDLLYWENQGNQHNTVHEYKPDDFVRIRDGNKIQLCKAKDLEHFKNVQAGWHYGTKVVMGVLDAAMIATGTIEFSAGLKAASLATRAATATGKAAVQFSGREAAVQMGRGLFRAGVGGAGIFNNAWGHHDEVGIALNKARTYYFMFDIARGFVPQKAANLLRPSPLTEVANVGKKFDEVIQDSKWLFPAPKYAEKAFKWSERGMVPLVGRDFIHVVFEGHPKPHLSYAEQLKGDRHAVKLPEKGIFDLGKKENYEATQKLVDNYSTTLQDGRDDATKRQIAEIFDKTKKAMAPDAKPEEREQFKKEMLDRLTMDQESVRAIEKSLDRKLTDDEAKQLLDPEKRRGFSKEIQKIAEAADAKRNRDLCAASAMAVIFLATDKDGKLAAEAGKTAQSIEKQEWTEVVSAGESVAYIPHKIDAHDLNLNFSSGDLVAFLKRDLEVTANQLGNRGLVTGDLLMRVGGISGVEYGNVLQDVLKNPEASKADKMRALSDKTGPRFAEVLDSLTAFEQAAELLPPEQRAQAHAIAGETSSESLKNTLHQMAKNDKDPDVRAMAAAVLHGVGDRERVNTLATEYGALRNHPAMTPERWQQTQALFSNDAAMKSDFLDNNHKAWEAAGAYSEKTIKVLRESATQAIPADCPPEKAYLLRERKLNAALNLSALQNDADTKKVVGQAIADSILSTPDMDKLLNDPLSKHLHSRYLELATKGAQALFPTGENGAVQNPFQLDEKTAASVRSKLLSAVRTPTDFTEETKQVELIKSLRGIINEGAIEERRELAVKCQKMIDPKAPEFARSFGLTRVEAINTLADFGNRDALDLIRARTTTALTLRLPGNDKTIANCAENDARVRLAAVAALEKLTDERLGEVVAGLVANENDPIVSVKLRAIAARFENPSEDQRSKNKRQYDAVYQSTMAKLTRDPRYSVVDGMSNQQVYDWLKHKDGTRLLNRDNWYADRSQRAQDVYNNWGNWDWFWSRRKTVAEGMNKGAENSDNEREALFGRFCRLAKGQAVDGLNPGALMPDNVNLSQLKEKLTKEISVEVESLKKQRESIDKQIAEKKTQTDEEAKRELVVLQAQKEQIEKDERRAAALYRQMTSGMDLNNQLEIVSAMAKRQLYLMVADGASGIEGTPAQKNPTYNEYNLPNYASTMTMEQWKLKATEALAECCKPGAVGRGLAVEYVKQLLVTKEVPANCRKILLDAFKEVAKPEAAGLRQELSLNEDELAVVTLKALDVELGRAEGEQSKDFQLQLIRDLRGYGYRPGFAVLDGMMDSGKFSKLSEEVRNEASKTLNLLRDGLIPIWNRTKVDTATDAATRARNVTEQSDLFAKYAKSPFADREIAADQMIQSIFNNYKHYRAKSADDPSVAPLSQLMTNEHQKVRSAAAMMALESTIGLPGDNSLRRQALLTLSDLAVRGSTPQYRYDAYVELRWFAGKNVGDWQNDVMTFESGEGAQKKTYALRRMKDNASLVERTNGDITGVMYPDGTACQFVKENGELSVVVENGATFIRKKDASGKFTTEWQIVGGEKWHGTATLSAGGTYTYQKAGHAAKERKPN